MLCMKSSKMRPFECPRKTLGSKGRFVVPCIHIPWGPGPGGPPRGGNHLHIQTGFGPSTFSPAVQYAKDLVPLHRERKFNSSAYPISQAYIISQEHFQLSTSLPNPQFSCCIGRSTRNIYRSLQLTKCDHNPYNPFDTNILKFAATRRM